MLDVCEKESDIKKNENENDKKKMKKKLYDR